MKRSALAVLVLAAVGAAVFLALNWPAAQASADGTFSQVSAGHFHTCGLKTDGTVICWGKNDYGEATPPAGTFSQVSAGGSHTCGVKTDDTLACWGFNPDGQATPPTGTFSQVSAGGSHACGVKTDGTLVCWGRNYNGQATPPTGTFSQVTAGKLHSCGLKTDGTVICWGLNDQGQATPPTGTFNQVSAGGRYTCGVKTDDTVICWGENDQGQATPPTGTFSQVSAGGSHACGVKKDGTLACWGFNPDGQATPPTGTFSQVSAGWIHSCGLKTDGTLACWGSNTSGQATPPAGTNGAGPDGDGDTVPDADDADPSDPLVCQDLDGDTCDDCSLAGVRDPANDGPDSDGDGLCDAGDPDGAGPDGDGDTVPDADDANPTDPFMCQDLDGDTCDDCWVAGVADPANDGPDSDGDGLCDAGDPDFETTATATPTPCGVCLGQMHYCPKPGKWAISVWGGADGTDTDMALATCAHQVDAAYRIHPSTQAWSRYFRGRPEISNLATIDNGQGVIALGAGVSAVSILGDEPLRVMVNGMEGCPQAGKWAISVWEGADSTDTDQALATCGQGAVAAAYSIDPDTQGWLRWFDGRPEVSNLESLDDMTGVIALGAMSALPSTARIAFHSNGGEAEIYVINADGSGQINLTNNPADDHHPAWSPDSTQIAFVSYGDGNNEIYVMNADGSGQINLTDDPGNDSGLAWSPDGSRIAFDSDRDGNSQIYVMNADGTGQTNCTNSSASDYEPRWSPDGSQIAFVSSSAEPLPYVDGIGSEIHVMKADCTGRTQLTNKSRASGDPAWSPDSSQIAFVSRVFGSEEIYVTNADGTGETLLLTSTCDANSLGCGVGGPLSWSPNGSRIAFTWYRDGNGEIYVMNADGTDLVNLTQNPANDQSPAWSPDGSQIAFVSDRDGDGEEYNPLSDEIYVMKADGSDATRLTSNSVSDGSPVWSPGPAPMAFLAPITFSGWIVSGCPQSGEEGDCSLEIDVQIRDVTRMEQADASFEYAPDEVITVILWPSWASESVPDLATGDLVEVSGQERMFGGCVEDPEGLEALEGLECIYWDSYGFVVLPDGGEGNYIRRL